MSGFVREASLGPLQAVEVKVTSPSQSICADMSA
jgi:hypothetical protein